MNFISFSLYIEVDLFAANIAGYTFISMTYETRPATRGGQSGNCHPKIFTNVCIC